MLREAALESVATGLGPLSPFPSSGLSPSQMVVRLLRAHPLLSSFFCVLLSCTSPPPLLTAASGPAGGEGVEAKERRCALPHHMYHTRLTVWLWFSSRTPLFLKKKEEEWRGGGESNWGACRSSTLCPRLCCFSYVVHHVKLFS